MRYTFRGKERPGGRNPWDLPPSIIPSVRIGMEQDEGKTIPEGVSHGPVPDRSMPGHIIFPGGRIDEGDGNGEEELDES